MAPRYQTFREFWPFYVREHSKPLTRQLHFIGTSLVVLLAGLALATRHHWLGALMPIAGYGFAWVAHFFVEGNKPATFKYPLWSLGADFVMWAKMWTGGMEEEVRAAHAAVDGDA